MFERELIGSALFVFWGSLAETPLLRGLTLVLAMLCSDARVNPVLSLLTASSASQLLVAIFAQIIGSCLGAWAVRAMLGPGVACFDSALVGAAKAFVAELVGTVTMGAAFVTAGPVGAGAALAIVAQGLSRITGAALNPAQYLASLVAGHCDDGAVLRAGAYLGGQLGGAFAMLVFVTIAEAAPRTDTHPRQHQQRSRSLQWPYSTEGLSI